MGISDLNTVGVMSWLDGTENVYNNWDYYQTMFPGKKCGVISTNFNWKYKPCDKARGFVCKRPLRGKRNDRKKMFNVHLYRICVQWPLK